MKTEKYKTRIAALRTLADKLEACDAAETDMDRLRCTAAALLAAAKLRGATSSATKLEQVTLSLAQIKELFPNLIVEEKQ